MDVVPLARNSPPTFYRGSGRIDAFRGTPADGDDRPEDWVASTVTRHGAAAAGLTVLPDGRQLRAAVRDDPLQWMGIRHRSDVELEVPLVKLLDAGQRLPVHVHPDDRWARRAGGWPKGKAEAWFVVEAPGTPVVHLGWTRDVTAAELADWVDRQDVSQLLGAMHTLPVSAGDTVYVPPGTAHAIGCGILLVEVQQPADLSVLLEWEGFFPDGSGAFLGLDQATALGCVSRRGLSLEGVDDLIRRGALHRPPGNQLLPDRAGAYFSADLLGAGSTVPAAYRTLVVLAGAGSLRSSANDEPPHAIGRGDTLAVPAAAGPLQVAGSADLRVLAFGPGRGSSSATSS